ncbi:MAG TPA: redoxin domain-containing protein [Caulobacteraceae bacterium]|nr:redoxin domain-containing protein [Caulobacteraceae bacterium]
MRGFVLSLAFAVGLTLTAPTVASAAFAPLQYVDIGQAAPQFSAMAADGKAHALSDYAGKVVILEWTSPACQFTAAKYKSGAMQALQRKAAKEGFVWLSVDTGAPGKPSYLTPAQARARVAKLNAKVTGFLFDVDGKIGRAYGAKTTPSFFIIGKDGKLAYQGAIDDDWGGPGKTGKKYVADAIDDLAAGKPVRTPKTRQWGCEVNY